MVRHRKGVKHAGWRQIGRGQWVTTGRQARRASKRRAYRRGALAVPGYTRTVGYYGRTGEVKFHDVDLDDAVVAANGTVTASINLIPQGTTEVTRIGRKCTITSIGWKFDMTLPVSANAAGVSSDHLRVMLILDKQCNGAAATALNVLETDDYQSFNNLANKGRFQTLMDREYDLNYITAAGNGTANDWAEAITSDSFYKKCNIPIEFDNTTGAITEIRSNNLFVLLEGRSGVVGFASKIRLRFTG